MGGQTPLSPGGLYMNSTELVGSYSVLPPVGKTDIFKLF